MEDFISQDEFNLELSAFDEALINIECDDILILAGKCGKQLEVCWGAFKHKEQFPTASFLECLQVGAKSNDIYSSKK